jgi:predicted membrane-bound spermidine synthase
MLRIAALLLTVLTGFSGLVYEVSWEKYLATLLGSHSEATAAVLGLFLGGLALGYALFGRVTQRRVARARATGRPARLLCFYGFVEAGIGVYALLFPSLFQAAHAISFLVPHGSGGLGFAFDVALSALLIGPPAVLMGPTIPILTQALARGLADATRFHALVYGFNTAGAFAGALAAGYWLIPALGLVGVLVAMGLVNLAAGASFIVLGLRAPAIFHPQRAETEAEESAAASAPQARAQRGEAERSQTDGEPQASEVQEQARRGRARSEPQASEVQGLRSLAVAALLLGFAMMSIQTVLIRLGALSFGSSQFTFSMVVAVFVLCIALGSFAVSAFPRIPGALIAGNLWAGAVCLLLLYRPLQNAPYWAHVLRSLFRDVGPGFYPYHLSAFVGTLLAIGLPVLLSGAALPLIFHHLRREVGDLGGVAGRLYSWNTVGSLLGALLGGYLLLYWIDLHQVYRLATAAVAVGALLVTFRVLDVSRLLAALLLLVPLLAQLVLLPAWSPERLASGLYRTRSPTPRTFAGPDAFFAKHELLASYPFYDDDPTASIAVKEEPLEDGTFDRAIVSNGKSDGSVRGDYVTMALTGLIPALLADKVERAFVIGYGTGVTAGELAGLRSVREVVVAEISPAVIRAAPLFDHANLSASRHSAVRILPGDAYRTLLRSEGSFDVIASEPSNPWVTGVEMLYSREFLEAARDRLAPGGVYAQWFHSYETDNATVAMVIRTYAAVFDHVALWYANGPDLLLLGLRDPRAALDLDRLEARVARPDFAAGLRRAEIRSLPELLAHELLPVGVVHAASLEGDLHTLLHPRLSHLAARAFFTGPVGGLPVTAGLEAARVGRANSLVRRLAARHGGRLPEDLWGPLVFQTCRSRHDLCLTLFAQWIHEVPESPTRERVASAVLGETRPGRKTQLDLVRKFSRLYGGAPLAPEAEDLLLAAKQATTNFVRYYHHAAPFSRRALAELWRRCEVDEERRDRCREARARAEERLGDLETGLASEG